jgi:hypothetical protein
MSASFPGLVDLVLDENGAIAYLVSNSETLEIASKWGFNGTLFVPPAPDDLPFLVAEGENIIKLYDADDITLLDDVMSYLKRFSYLADSHFLIIACNIFLSYLQDHKDVHYIPEISFFAAPERGKSRTGKAITYASYRGIHVVDLREANLFRYSQNLRATIFFDMKNLWKKAEKSGSEDLILLRFEKGAKVSRVLYPDRGPFKDMVHYDVFGPTIIATNEALHKILDTRCISLPMPNKPGDYENPIPRKGLQIRERLTAWRARVGGMALPELEPIPGLQGRLWDISKPLLQVCKMVAPDKVNDVKEALLEVAHQRTEDNRASIEGQIVAALEEASPEGLPEWTIDTGDILDKLNVARPDKYKLLPQYLGKKLKAMGIKTRLIHGYSEIVLQREVFETLRAQFTFHFPPKETLPNSTTLKKEGIATELAGRGLVESAENCTQIPPAKSPAAQGNLSLVESGRELCGGQRKWSYYPMTKPTMTMPWTPFSHPNLRPRTTKLT